MGEDKLTRTEGAKTCQSNQSPSTFYSEASAVSSQASSTTESVTDNACVTCKLVTNDTYGGLCAACDVAADTPSTDLLRICDRVKDWANMQGDTSWCHDKMPWLAEFNRIVTEAHRGTSKAPPGLITLDRGMYERTLALLEEAGVPGIVAQCVQTLEDRVRTLIGRSSPSSGYGGEPPGWMRCNASLSCGRKIMRARNACPMDLVSS